MELKEGMYVRFTNLNKSCQYIGKLENINECRDPRVKNAVHVNWIDDYVFIGDNDIIKASFKIIDLIEAGDYVNGERVTSCEPVDEKDEERYLGFGDYDYYIHDSKDIKSIVTKEQFNSMKYEVGE